LQIEVLQAFGIAQALLDHVTRHQATGLLGVEADDLVLTVLLVLEYRLDQPALEGLRLDRAEVFLGGEAEQDVIPLLAQIPVQPLGELLRSEEHTSELQSRENIVC